MTDIYGVTSVGTITVLCYVLAQIVKTTSLDNKWIPIICLISGGIFGILGMHYIIDFPSDDMLSAIAIGIVSGGAATNINQIYKQLDSGNSDDKS